MTLDFFDPRTTDELFEAALSFAAGDEDDRPSLGALVALQHRATREVLELAIEHSESSDQDERLLGVAVLAELRVRAPNWVPAFVEESVAALLDLAERETDDEVLAHTMRAFGYRGSARALDVLLAHVGHPDQLVRFFVACSLPSCTVPDTEPQAAAALIELAGDEDADVRDYALFGFPQLQLDTEEIRQAMLACVEDEDDDVAGQALISLSFRRDERAIHPLIRYLQTGRTPGWAFCAAGHLAHADLLPVLRATSDYAGSDREQAIRACETGIPTA